MEEQDLRIVRRAVNGILSEFDYKTNELNQRSIKEITSVIKKNDGVIFGFCVQIFEELNKKDCDRRLGMVLITDYFFQRSHKFRLEIIKHLQDFMMLSLETDAVRCPLPDPVSAARNLKKWSLKIVKGWIEKFGAGYVKLKGAEQYLKNNKNFDFQASGAELLIERQRTEEDNFKQRVNAKKCGEAIQQVLNESRPDILRTLLECRNSIDLLYPDIFEQNSTDKPTSSKDLTPAEFQKLHGYKPNTDVEVVIRSGNIVIEENEDNKDLVNALQDAAILLKKSMSTLQKWLKRLVQVGGDQNQALVKEIVELKGSLQRELNRCDQLKIVKADSDEDDESDGFVDVEDDEAALLGFDADELPPTSNLAEVDDQKPSTSMLPSSSSEGHNNVKNGQNDDDLEQKPSTSLELDDEKPLNLKSTPKTAKTLKSLPKDDIPRVRFGLDLKYWGQKVEPASVDRNIFDGHRFWKGYDPGSDTAKEAEEIYTEREILFIGKRPEIKKSCRFPMENGKLCPRMDLERCPFHGPIVERDEMGFPVHELGRT
ncbi:unnamed protein product [Bursaphelenchus okinawaensis]|uniref:UV-stimulated scaffold protein A C-terminal domain-containing protein n=1 Tax=Bursaphelenchus okinawaensis TaxID=465554 RepID=A0A811KSE5_9BILA|nr:unnamed protein product [Bursaphelenchus okinawaensis]CAG9109747.1 unnamed protein product [Bursaphelenchus okinawaensis]